MKQTVLGMPAPAFQKQLNRRTALCIAILALTVGLNVLLTALRTELTHTLMLILNIAADATAGCFLIWYAQTRLFPQKRLYRLATGYHAQVTGTVTAITPHTTRYMELDCHQVTADGRRLFLPNGTLHLEEDTAYTFRTVSNIIVEADR